MFTRQSNPGRTRVSSVCTTETNPGYFNNNDKMYLLRGGSVTKSDFQEGPLKKKKEKEKKDKNATFTR